MIPQTPTPSRSVTPVSRFIPPLSLVLNSELGVTLDDLKNDLARMDATLKKSGMSYAHETTPSQFILKALEIEDQQ